MGEKLVIGPINRGLRTDRTAFVIDNDSFPTLINAYQWRGRVKRKRGTQFLGRLSRYLGTTDGSGNLTVTIAPTPIISGIVSFTIGTDIFTDQGGSSPVTMITNSATGTGVLNRSTGVLTITSSQPATAVIYYPSLPVMGLEDFILASNAFPGTVAFDTQYSYGINTSSPYPINDVSFYKNPPTGTPATYVQKSTWTPTSWNGQTYQQFWTVNYQGALWATNGINIPFSITNIGMQYAPSASIVYVSNTATTLVVTIAGSPLVVGDFVFVNEWTGTNANTLNFQTGYVTLIAGGNITITFPNANIGAGPYSPGIIQYLTNRSDATKDCLRWYDGDPTNGSTTAPVFVPGNGWVNFAPPLSQAAYTIADNPAAQYYLVGARMIVPFKDRLLFFGPVIQTSSAGSQVYLQDTVIYSQNGTPYYTCSFTGNPVSSATVFNPLLVPTNQTATAPAFFEDQTGFGGFLTAGIDQPIVTTAFNEDVIIVGFKTLQSRLAYTGNDIVPFNFFQINTEYGSSSTFSTVTLDKGVITRGDKGYIITSQVDCQRIDLEIPDQVFEINATNNGTERFCSYRDFINEWIYFTYPSDMEQANFNFPNQTLQYNYRDNSWAIFNETYTTYGAFRKQTGFTWATVGNIYPTWAEWNDPWDAGDSQLEQPIVLAGNQQGFVLIRGFGTGEGTSLTIQNISTNTITVPNHCLNANDYIIISDCQGAVSTQVNGMIFSVAPIDQNTFSLNPPITSASYEGGGLITRIYVPFIQTKQFPVAWDMARKTRLGPQQYLFSTTDLGQITLLIYLSQNSSFPYNFSTIYPDPSSVNSGLIYSTILYTCPESTNLGLTPANINLQIPTAIQQAQTWHRMNTSLIGDTVQIGFTLFDDQLRNLTPFGNTFAITGATQTNPCVLSCTGLFQTGLLIQINNVQGMTQLNGNTYQVITSNPDTVTIDVNATAFDSYTSGGTAVAVANFNNFSEIELHSIVLDVQPSQLLV